MSFGETLCPQSFRFLGFLEGRWAGDAFHVQPAECRYEVGVLCCAFSQYPVVGGVCPRAIIPVFRKKEAEPPLQVDSRHGCAEFQEAGGLNRETGGAWLPYKKGVWRPA